jgi:predicted enzyme related to lactoylglutathione lyase
VVAEPLSIPATFTKSKPSREKGEQKVNRYTKHNSSEVKPLKTKHIAISNRDKNAVFPHNAIGATTPMMTDARKKISHRRTKRPNKRAAHDAAPPRLAGVELYFDNLDRAKTFYRDCLGLSLADEEPGHHAKFHGGSSFVCLERKGAENYPSADKAVLFFEVADLNRTIARIGPERILHHEPNPGGRRSAWAVLHDPEGHNILLVEKNSRERK